MQLFSVVVVSSRKTIGSDGEELALAIHELLRRVRFDDVEEVCCWGLSKTECHVLEVIALEGPLSVNDVAARIRLNKSTASRVVKSLSGKELVTAESSEEDRRGLRVTASKKGLSLWREIVRASAASYEDVLRDCSPAERKAVTSVLRRLAR